VFSLNSGDKCGLGEIFEEQRVPRKRTNQHELMATGQFTKGVI